jgi:hypothetical protein
MAGGLVIGDAETVSEFFPMDDATMSNRSVHPTIKGTIN